VYEVPAQPVNGIATTGQDIKFGKKGLFKGERSDSGRPGGRKKGTSLKLAGSNNIGERRPRGTGVLLRRGGGK